MRIRILGGGWYGCHIARRLKQFYPDVELHETSERLFSGASGGNPARLHLGFHYPRSRLTRAMSQEHYTYFMKEYGFLTRGVPVNIYAVAAQDSLVDFGTYCQVLRDEVEMITVASTAEYGLENVEGAVLTGERHLIIEDARTFFTEDLADVAVYRVPPTKVVDDDEYDWTIDCTFCALDALNVDRYEPCITVILKGPVDRAVTIMDGPFPSLYPWNENEGLCSLTSAKLTPFKRCASRKDAEWVLDRLTASDISSRCAAMADQMAYFYPAVRQHYEVVDHKLSIRAMPRSGADARLVDVTRVGKRALRVRAGKIDAVEHAYGIVHAIMRGDA